MEVFDESKGFGFVRSIAVDSAADNLKFIGNDLWIGAHPKLLQVPIHMHTNQTCPSQVLVVKNAATEENPTVEVVLQRMDGNPVSGVSTGVEVNGKLLLGTMRDGFAVCEKKVVKEKLEAF